MKIGDIFSYKNLLKVEMSFVPLIQINEWSDINLKKYAQGQVAAPPEKRTASYAERARPPAIYTNLMSDWSDRKPSSVSDRIPTAKYRT